IPWHVRRHHQNHAGWEHPKARHIHAAHGHTGGEPQHVSPGEPRQHNERGGYDCTIALQRGFNHPVGHVNSAHDAGLAEMDLGKLGIAVSKLEFDRPVRLSPTTSDFGERVFEAVYHVDAHAMGCACHWIEDWFAAAVRYTRHNEPR